MRAFEWQLSHAQIAAVTTYVRNNWDRAAAATSVRDVRKVRDRLDAANN